MKPRFDWRHQYDTERDKKEGNAAICECLDESLTQQHFTKDADLNEIARRFGINEIPSTPLDPALFRDTTQDPDLRQILEIQRQAKDGFLSLPAKIRKRFHYSPTELWEFLNDPENAEEAVRLGLLHATPTSADATVATAPSAPTAQGATTGTTNANAQGAPKSPPDTPPQTSQKGT